MVSEPKYPSPGAGAPAPSRHPEAALHRLPRLRGIGRALAVVAHPDDESFGLGAVLSTLHTAGCETAVLCFTHGEASTLGHGAAGELGALRAGELAAAALTLGVGPLLLLDHPDGLLTGVPLDDLARSVARMAKSTGAVTLLVFDEGGITGHKDHQRATEAARAAARELGLDVLAWTLPASVTAALNAEFRTEFVGRQPEEIDVRITVDRERQRVAIRQHPSQATGNAVLWRRLELLGDQEALRFLAIAGRPVPGRVSTASAPQGMRAPASGDLQH